MKYSAIIEDHFSNPRNVGPLEGNAVVGEAVNSVCLDKLRLWLEIDGGRVTRAAFQAEGCVPSIAVGSFLTEFLLQKSSAELQHLDADAIESAVGGLPRTKKHAAQLAVEAIHDALGRVE